jgi:hypothetical protein
MADKKNDGPARHKSGGQAYIPNNPRWARFPENKIGPKMRAFVGVTDNDWFAFLSQRPGIDEVNFSQLRPIGGQDLHREFPLAREMHTSSLSEKKSN